MPLSPRQKFSVGRILNSSELLAFTFQHSTKRLKWAKGQSLSSFPTSLLASLLIQKIGRSNVMKGLFMKNAKAEGKRDLFFKEIEEENGEMQAGRKSFEI